MRNDIELNQNLMVSKETQNGLSQLDDQLEKSRFHQEQIEIQRNLSTMPQISEKQQNRSESSISQGNGYHKKEEIVKCNCECNSKLWFAGIIIIIVGIIIWLMIKFF